MGLGDGEGSLGCPPGPHGGTERGVVVAGRIPVVGEAGPALLAGQPDLRLAVGERGGVAAVQAVELAGQDVAEHGLVHERMAEAVAAAVLVGDQQSAIDGGAQGTVQAGDGADVRAGAVSRPGRGSGPRVDLLGGHHVGQQVVLHLAPARRARAQHGRRVRVHAFDAAEDRVP